MTKLRELLERVEARLGLINRRIGRAYIKQDRRRKQADRNEGNARKYATAADRARKNGRPRKAAKLDKASTLSRANAERNRAKARWWIGRIKDLKIQKEGRNEVRAELLAELAKLEAKRIKIDVDGNKITGGNAGERFRAACLLSAKRCADGKRRNFYSQPGLFSVDRCFTGELYGQRSDCSQWITSVCWSAGLDDPNGQDWKAGYTGTMIGGHGKWGECSRDELLNKGWGYVVYGAGTGFHTEAYVGPGNRTIGHGDAAINAGDLDMFSPRRYFIYK
jgi:hypothetical protein